MSIANNMIEVGDTVRMRIFSVQIPSGLWPDDTYTVITIPSPSPSGTSLWTIKGDQTGKLLATTERLFFEVLN